MSTELTYESLKGKTLNDLPRSQAAMKAAADAAADVERLADELAALDSSAGDGPPMSARDRREQQARRLQTRTEWQDACDLRDDERARFLTAKQLDFQTVKPLIAAEHGRRLKPVLELLDELDGRVADLLEVERVAGSFELPMGSISSRRCIAQEVVPPFQAFIRQWRNALRSMLAVA